MQPASGFATCRLPPKSSSPRPIWTQRHFRPILPLTPVLRLRVGGTMSARQDSLVTTGLCGRSLARKFGAEDSPCVVTRSLQRTDMAVTEVRADRPLGGLSDP